MLPRLPDPYTYPHDTYVVEEQQFGPSVLPIVGPMEPPGRELGDALALRTTFAKRAFIEDGVEKLLWIRQEDEPTVVPYDERF